MDKITKAIGIRFLYLVLGGSLMMIFILVAQVSMEDFRLKTGGLRPVPDPVLQVGGFYTVKSTGQLTGPHCMINREVFKKYYVVQRSTVRISNIVGASLPIVSNWTANLLGWIGAGEIMQIKSDNVLSQTVNWQGHTLNLASVVHRRLKSTSTLATIIDESYKLDPNCEETVLRIVNGGSCVAIVFRVTSVSEQKVGYRLAGDGHCMLPIDATAPMFQPRQPKRFSAYLTTVKDWLGLIDQVVGDA